MSTLVVLLLTAGRALALQAPEVKVHRVTLELPRGEAARVKRYVTVQEGERWDPTKVRQTVELLFATGEFEDVPVDVLAGPEGIDVAIRPRPAPRLLEVEVEGDAVRSARELRTLARLHAGEALWPNRLEAAGREVTRALVAAGYLEAQVKAEARPAADPFQGADLVFHIAAGPRARVAKLGFEGLEIPERTLLAGTAEPPPGAPFERARAEKAARSMRRRLVAAGRWGARVEVRDVYDPSSAQVELIFAVTAGPISVLEIQGASFPHALEREIEQILREGALRKDSQEAGGERLEAELRRGGHRDAQVRVREEERSFGVAVVYEVRSGDSRHEFGNDASVHGHRTGLLRCDVCHRTLADKDQRNWRQHGQAQDLFDDHG